MAHLFRQIDDASQIVEAPPSKQDKIKKRHDSELINVH